MDSFLDALRTRLKFDEGLRLMPYLDTTEHWTIGHGHNLHEGISLAIADAILEEDIHKALRELDRNKPWWVELPHDAKVVVASMQFNMGWPRFSGFKKFWAALESRNYQLAAHEMRDSLWFSQVRLRGVRLANMMDAICSVR